MYTTNDHDSNEELSYAGNLPNFSEEAVFCFVDDDRGATIQIELGKA